MEKIWKNKHVSRLTKTRTIKTMVFPEVLYGCETWTKTKATEKKNDACEIWIWRKILRVAWTERRTNKSILQGIGEMGGGLSLLQNHKTEVVLRHVMRADGLEKEMMLACGEGRRRRGWPRKGGWRK